MKTRFLSTCVMLLALALAVFEIAGYAQSANEAKQKPPGVTTSDNDRLALYVARVISVSPAKRDAYVACLQERELPIWRKLKRDGLLGTRACSK